MSEHKISFTDDQEKAVQNALDARNQYLTNATLPTLDMDQFLQESCESLFHCSIEDLATNTRNTSLQLLMNAVVKVPTEKIPLVISAAESAGSAVLPK